MLKKLSSLRFKIDKAGTVTVILGGGDILKISPLEILVIADEIIKIQSKETKMKYSESIYLTMLKSLEIPEEIIETIRTKLQTKSNLDKSNLKKKDKLLEFISSFVNEKCEQNEFDIKEFDFLGMKTDELIKKISEYGFEVRKNNNEISIKKILER